MAERVRIGQLARVVGLHENTIRRLADAGIIPSERTEGGQRVFNIEAVADALAARSRNRHPSRLARVVVKDDAVSWEKTVSLPGLQEHEVWREIVQTFNLDTKCGAADIIPMAFNEMLNNAIDHSEGSKAKIKFVVTQDVWSFEIVDDGCGVYSKIMKEFKLENRLESVAELSKGKQTTAPKAHSGEGIFFTSKAVDVFELSSDGIQWTVDNLLGDFSVGQVKYQKGTRVFCQLQVDTARKYIDVFREFTVNHHFVRTRPTVKLFETGMTFVSRSEARRLLVGLGKFSEIELDFEKVDAVGQGFVDEIFRVWASDNLDKKIIPINMNDAVSFMVNRGSAVRH
ncbi:MAG: DUF4325 domain-containing protein [Candidatus Nanopelagicaceae bacterium]|nr:DUF4325 domain-containing protein [Candidatus Nanopelagicaceae bacterium]